jgi:4-amino-4-deoxy-L-arabinose transferase-like glycosyltransferase
MPATIRARILAGRVALRRWARDPAVLVQMAFVLAIAVGFFWGLPGSDSWAADSVSPRSCGLGAIIETYWPRHFHHYPPLHVGLLTVLSLPWIGLAVRHVGTGTAALGAELVKPLYMTGIEIGARLVAAAMAIAIVRSSMVLWGRLAGRRAGVAAGAIVATNSIFVFYAHTGNLDVPYLFWLALAFIELDRVACGEARETHALLFGTAAVLTKDQSFGALILTFPVYLVVVPWLVRRTPVARRTLIRAALISIGTYALVSGALVNPIGFRDRLAHLFGPDSKPWMQYSGDAAGALALTRDALRTTTDFTSWPVVVAAFVGVAVALWQTSGLARARLLLPLLATISFAMFFSLPVRMNEHRYFLPESIFFAPYAAVALEYAWVRWSRARPLVAAIAAASIAPALLGVASLDATLLADSRHAAERFLSQLPTGTHIEVYGGPIFMPRIPSQLVAVRPGIEPIAERQAIAGVTDLVDPTLDPRPRAPEAIVLATELSDESVATPSQWDVAPATMQYNDRRSHAFIGALIDGSLGYERTLRATCVLPWPLACRRVHHSTGGEVWIYARSQERSPPDLSFGR